MLEAKASDTASAPSPKSVWFVRAFLLSSAACIMLALPGPDDIMEATIFWVLVPLPSYLGLALLTNPQRAARFRAGLTLSRTVGLAQAPLGALGLYSQLFVAWPTRIAATAALAVFLLIQIGLAGVAWALLRRTRVPGDAPPAQGRDRALLLIGHTIVLAWTIGFLVIPWGGSESGVARRESSAIGTLRTFTSAQAAFASANGGFYGTPDCLVTPSRCIPGYAPSSPTFMSSDGMTSRGYVYTFHKGQQPAFEEVQTLKAAPSSLKSWAYVAVPEAPGRSGVRSFCVDDSGALGSTDAAMPARLNARCPASLAPIR